MIKIDQQLESGEITATMSSTWRYPFAFVTRLVYLMGGRMRNSANVQL